VSRLVVCPELKSTQERDLPAPVRGGCQAAEQLHLAAVAFLAVSFEDTKDRLR
jgi:hypothetical protein